MRARLVAVLVAGLVAVPVATAPAARESPVAPEARYHAALAPSDDCWTSCEIHPGGQESMRTVGAERAWDISTGSPDVVVAVVDTLVAADHPQLAGKVVVGPDLRGPACAWADPLTSSHGTAVAGLIAARTDDGIGMASLGWQTTVLSIPVLDDCGWATASALAAGIRAAVDAGARIINLSLSGPPDPAVEDAVAFAQDHGVLLVAAAGNDPRTVSYPGAYPGVIAVGATDDAGVAVSAFSPVEGVDIVAPGEAVLSTSTIIGGYWLWTGTSFATPLVAAAAALDLAVHPGFDADDLARRLLRSTRSIGPALPGLLDAGAMLEPGVGSLVLATSDGGALTIGAARFHGSAAVVPLRAPIVAIAAGPGDGYWLVAADGGVFSFGAPFLGSTAQVALRAPIVGAASTATRAGYWLAAADGGVFAFGDAPFLGSSARTPGARIVAISATRTGRGYWLLRADGVVESFGDALWFGDAGGGAVSIASTSAGYWVLNADGGVEAHGDAPALRAPTPLPSPATSIAALAGEDGYWIVTADGRPLGVGRAVDGGRVRTAAPVVGAAAVG